MKRSSVPMLSNVTRRPSASCSVPTMTSTVLVRSPTVLWNSAFSSPNTALDCSPSARRGSVVVDHQSLVAVSRRKMN
ncbi:hypothetical protein D3C71_1073710 [compost metagenome]